MPQWMITALRLTGLGWYVAACIVLGIVGGVWLDGLTGLRIVFTLVGTVLGSIIAFYGVYRMVLPAIYGSGGSRRPSTPTEPRNQDTDHGGNGYS